MENIQVQIEFKLDTTALVEQLQALIDSLQKIQVNPSSVLPCKPDETDHSKTPS